MPPDALATAESMTETLTPHEAATLLRDASRYEESLRQRTEGLTWMVWGLATPAIFMTYGFAAVIGGSGWWMGLLWIPWVAAAGLTVHALWRSAALSSVHVERRSKSMRKYWTIFAVYVVLFTGLFWLVPPTGPEFPLTVVGAIWVAMGLLNVWRSSETGRMVAVAAGTPLALAGGLLWAFHAPMELSSMVSFVLSGVAPMGAGLWQTRRG